MDLRFDPAVAHARVSIQDLSRPIENPPVLTAHGAAGDFLRELQVVSGHLMLVSAALSGWHYLPFL